MTTSDDSSNTTPKQQPRSGGATGKGFVKGDPRINRKGRPKTFDKLRELVKNVLNEVVETPNGQTTRLMIMIKSMTTNDNPADHRLLFEYGFGKVKDEIEVEITVYDSLARKLGVTPQAARTIAERIAKGEITMEDVLTGKATADVSD